MDNIVRWDARRLPLPDESVDHIFTDPPYGLKYLHCWQALVDEGWRVMRPGGFLMAMMGGLTRMDVYRIFLDSPFTYYWEYNASLGSKPGRVWKRGNGGPETNKSIVARLWPIMVWSKGQAVSRAGTTIDLIGANDDGRSWKDYHEWGAGELPVQYMIRRFTGQDDLILDPFLGGGTTGYVCKTWEEIRDRRRFIGGDVDPEAIKASKLHLAGVRPRLGPETLFPNYVDTSTTLSTS